MNKAGIAGVLLGLAATAAAAEEARWRREVTVPAAGPVAVLLDGRAAERAGFDLEVVAPDGRVLPATLGEGPRGEKQARVVRVLPSASGWSVELDLGPAPPRHAGLRFALARETAAGDVLLEGSGDGAAWRELARGDLFRLGSAAALQGLVFTYEPTDSRFLRLAWPREGGLPELSDAAALLAGDEGARAAVAVSCAKGTGPGELDCRWQLPSSCRDLELRFAPREATLGFNLWRAERGSWRELGGGERRRQGVLRLDLSGGAAYRARLESAGAPVFESASCGQQATRLHFRADAPGTYRLAYGRLAPPAERVCCAADAGDGNAPPSPPPLLLPPGPEIAADGAPEWPRAALPGPRLVAPPDGAFERSWKVETAAEKGQLVALALPAETQSATGNLGSGLRLAADGEQVPFLAEMAPLPELLLAKTLAPAGAGPARSRAILALPAESRDGELLLFARGPFERRLRFLHLEKTGPGRADTEREVGPGQSWSCPPSLARSCALWVPLHFDTPPAAPGTPRPAFELIVEVDDGDNPPLPELAAEVWVRQPLLYFVHPGSGVVLYESRRLAAPRYDFESLGPGLPREEAVAARLGKAEQAAGPADAPRWLLPLAIGLAALALLGVLARVLRQEPAS